MKKNLTPIYILVLFNMAILSPAFSRSLSWSDCVKQLVANNPELEILQHKLAAAEYLLKGTYSGFYPKVASNFTYYYKQSDSNINSKTITTYGKEYDIGISLSQNLFAGFQDQAKIKQVEAKILKLQEEVRIGRAQISYDLKSAYAELLFAQKAVTLQKEILVRRENNLRLVELRFENGRENKGSVLLSKAYLQQARYDKLQAHNNMEVAQSKLIKLLALDNNDHLELIVNDEPPRVAIPSNLQSQTYQALMRNSPNYKQLVAAEQQSAADLKLAKANFFPTLNLTTTFNKNGERWFPSDNRQWQAGIVLSIPLFSGGNDYYSVKNSVENSIIAALARQNGEREIVNKLKTAYTAFKEAIEKLLVDESFLQASMVREEIARNKYNNGLTSFDDWDTIENELITRENGVLESKKNRVFMEANWELAQGKEAF
ncbi:MAG: TolC family protein [Oligoflexia bacterium]|nr:TolC family protein [Oligoflexia bacterium]